MDLCRYCCNITLKRPSQSQLRCAAHQPSGEALQKSAHDGCPLCSKFWAALCDENEMAYDLHHPRHIDKEGIASDVYYDKSSSVMLQSRRNHYGGIRIICGRLVALIHSPDTLDDLLSRAYVSPDGRWLPGLNILLSRPSVSPECRWVPGPDHITNPSANLKDDCTGSNVNLELAKVWIRDCSTGHDLCDTGFFQTPPVLPSRVICVKNLQAPYLFETQGMCSEYLTLSYCWGHGKRLLTTKQTYPVFQTGLPADGQMPLTFQDAFEVSKALGYQYIWIDALCIIQEDEQDVQKEMAKMGDIYQNSTVTIFAASGNTTDSGLFVARNGPANKPTTVSMTMDHNDCLRTQDFTFLRPEYHAINPLSTRGWVLQEEVLSKCHLVFTPHEIQWKCKTKELSETLPYYNDIGGGRVESYVRMAHSVMGATSLIVSDPSLFKTMRSNKLAHSHFRIWYDLVELYSARSLTVSSDKLPAISGIARLIHRGFRCEYGAGLWKEDLPKGLCWYVEADITPSTDNLNESIVTTQQNNHAPSWSWASTTDRRIKFLATAIRDAEDVNTEIPVSNSANSFQVLGWDFQYMPGASTPFSHVKSGLLTLKGHMKMALLIPSSEEERKWGEKIGWKPSWAAKAIDPLSGSWIGEVALDYQNLMMTECNAFPDELAMSVSYLPLNITDLNTKFEEEHVCRQMFALVLFPHDIAKQEYRRVGLLWKFEWATDQSKWQFPTPEEIEEDNRQTVHIV